MCGDKRQPFHWKMSDLSLLFPLDQGDIEGSLSCNKALYHNTNLPTPTSPLPKSRGERGKSTRWIMRKVPCKIFCFGIFIEMPHPHPIVSNKSAVHWRMDRFSLFSLLEGGVKRDGEGDEWIPPPQSWGERPSSSGTSGLFAMKWTQASKQGVKSMPGRKSSLLKRSICEEKNPNPNTFLLYQELGWGRFVLF